MFAGVKGFFKSAIATAVDQYFNLVTLLLNTTSTNGAQNNTFLDSSSNAFSITRNGNATQGTFTPFSQTGWSNYFSSAQITTPSSADFAFGSGDFTVECFVNCVVPSSGYNDFVGTAFTNIGTNWFLGTLNGKLVWSSYQTNILNGSTAVPSNQWVHVVVSRVSGTTRFFLDGKLDGSVADSIVYTNVSVCGIGYGGGAYMANGYISNLRIVKGAGVTSVTVPTAPLSPVANTVLLTCQSSSFIDTNTQTTAKTLTVASGAPSVQALSPFAPTAAYSAATVGGSGYFDGSGDYVQFPTSSASLQIGTSTFTAELWCYTTSTAFQTLFSYGSSGADFRCFIDDPTTGAVSIWAGASQLGYATSTLRNNSWAHVVVQRDASNIFSVYVNGVRLYQVTNSGNYNTGTLSIGAEPAGGNPFTGYISGFKYTKGSALYSGTTITVPTAPPSATGATGCLLFTNAGIFDSTAKNDLETVGNAQVSTTQAKFGTTSMYFDGTNSYLSLKPTQLVNFGSSDFTIEFWIYRAAASASNPMYSTSAGAKADVLAFDMSAGGSLIVYATASGGSVWSILNGSAIGTLSTGTWHHVALVRNGSTWKGYLNGVAGFTVTNSAALASMNGFNIGYNGASAGYLNGYLDEVRISRYARYTANFTPPTTAFPVQ